MDALIRDVWHDLREKRLWPVAALLLIGLVAVPLVLIRPSEAPPTAPAPGAVATDAPELAAMATLVEASGGPQGRGSSLDSFEPRNPFKPAASVLESADSQLEPLTDVASPTTSTTSTAGGSIDSGSSDTGSGTTVSGGGAPSFTVGGGGDPGDGDSGGAPAPTPPQSGPDPEPQPREEPREEPREREPLTYAIDVTFGGPEQTREVRGLPRLAMLPHASVPLLIFLGVTDGGTDALFLVDSKLRPGDEGEGSCQPSPERCATLALEPGEVQTFVDAQDRSYALRLDQIRKVSVEQAIRRRRAADARAAASETEPQRFLPLLVDVLTGG